ncbi:integral membrane protein [Streptococcus pneumoniae]|nr:integral membrane protein [Streptococcus pneumoniae]
MTKVSINNKIDANFIKFFWRAGFLLTLIMYIEMIVELFLMK